MKRQVQGVILSLILVITLFSSMKLSAVSNTEPFGTIRTSVESGKTYTISTQEELARFSQLSRSSYHLSYYGVTILLTSDITVTEDYDSTSSGNWTPVYWFYGTFDGVGHTVTIQCVTNYTEIGFIGMNNGVVKNLTVAGSVSRNYGYSLGGIAGINYNTIINCRNSAAVGSNDSTAVGGITGINYGSIVNCYNSGAVSGTWLGGGIAGYGNQATFLNCYNVGTVTGTGYLGSVVGHISDTDTVVVKNCYWLSSSYTVGIGSVHADAPPENLIDFDTSGTLSSEVGGTTDLLQALNNWVFANQTASNDYFGWKTGSPYPILAMEPVIMTETLDTAVQAHSYSVSLGVISISSAAWALTDGTLPPGLILSSDGTISGTPTTGGTFNFTVSVQNGLGTASKALSLKVLLLQVPIAITDIPASVTYGDTSFTVSISGGSGTGELTLGISNETDLSGNSTTGVASINSSGLVTILRAGKFQITAVKAGDDSYAECSIISDIITVNQKPVTIFGIGAADKDCDGTDNAVITGLNSVVLTGILPEDNVSIDASNAVAYFSDSTAGNNKTVTFSGFTLTGADADKYTLASQPASVTANIRKVNPDYTLPGILIATEGQTLADIKLPADTDGVFTYDDLLTTPVGTPGEHNFNVTFTPYDTLNYKTETILVVIRVKAAATSPSTSSVTSKPSSNSAAPTSAETNSTASDVTAPQMGSPASYIPLLLIAQFSAVGFVLLKLRKSRITK